MSNVVNFPRKSPKLKSNENELQRPTKEQLSGFVATLQYLIDLNQSDSASIDIDADGEINFTLCGLQDFREGNDVVSGSNLELHSTGDVDFLDIPASIAIIEEMFNQVDLDNIPDPPEETK